MKRAGKWKLCELIGTGGNASVFKAIDNGGVYCALKRLNKNSDEEKYMRFCREALFIDSYPDLVVNNVLMPIIDKDLACERPYYVMPLAVPLKNIHFASLKEKCDAILDILVDLAELHKYDIAHRDIKPENILFYNGKFFLADFGLMYIKQAERLTNEKDKERIGAKRTIAPEMERSKVYDSDPFKADIYSMAKTIWMILTEDYECFEGQYDSDAVISLNHYNTVGTFDDGITTSLPYYTPLDKVLNLCTDHDPKRRPSITTLITGFENWIKINYSYHLTNKSEWYEITNNLFPVCTPAKAVWRNKSDIIQILDFLSKYKSLAYVFLPRGGMHYKGVKDHAEDKFIELDMGYPYLFPAKSLTFYSFGDKAVWNYFRLDSYEDIRPIFLDSIPEDITDADEELTELSPGEYAPLEVWDDRDEYKGYMPTKEMRRVARYYRGSFVIFNTRSYYNLESSTHNRHSHFSSEEFEFYIKRCSQGYYDLTYDEGLYEIVKSDYANEGQM